MRRPANIFNGPVTIRLIRSPGMKIGVCSRCKRSFERTHRDNRLTRNTCGRCMKLRFEALMERAARNQ